MVAETVREDEPKGKYYKFEARADGRVVLEPVRVPAHVMKERRAQLRKEQRIRAAHRNLQREIAMSRRFLVFITLAALFCCFVFYMYVSMRTQLQGRAQEISELQLQLESLAAENDILENRIENTEDITDIQETAKNVLGMVTAQQDQVIYYTVPDEDYMIQYDEVTDTE